MISNRIGEHEALKRPTTPQIIRIGPMFIWHLQRRPVIWRQLRFKVGVACQSLRHDMDGIVIFYDNKSMLESLIYHYR